MRFVEIALFALPFLVFALWRFMAPDSGPPKILVIGVAAAVAAMVLMLVALWYEDAAPADAGYVPARQEQGHIVPPKVEDHPEPAKR